MKKTIISLATVVVLFFALTSCQNFGTRLPFKAGELFYTKNVNPAEAHKVGDYLTGIGFFDDKSKISMQLDKVGETYLLKMCTKKEYYKDTSRDEAIRTVGTMVSTFALDKKPVDFYLCDDTFGTIRILKFKAEAPAEQAKQ